MLRLVTDKRTDGHTDWSSKWRQFYRLPSTKTLHWNWPLVYAAFAAWTNGSMSEHPWSSSLLPGTSVMRLWAPLSYLDIHSLICLSLSLLHFFFGQRIWRPCPCYSYTTHVYLSLYSPSPSPPTYTFNSLVFHSRVFSAPPSLSH